MLHTPPNALKQALSIPFKSDFHCFTLKTYSFTLFSLCIVPSRLFATLCRLTLIFNNSFLLFFLFLFVSFKCKEKTIECADECGAAARETIQPPSPPLFLSSLHACFTGAFAIFENKRIEFRK